MTAPNNPTSWPQREVLDGHNEVVLPENTVELEIKVTAKWFKTLEPGEKAKLLKLMGVRDTPKAAS
jgi:hypothetical protein